MSFLVIFYSYTPTRLGVSRFDRCGEQSKYCATITAHLPDGIAVFIPTDKFKKGNAVYLLPGHVFEVLCVLHG